MKKLIKTINKPFIITLNFFLTLIIYLLGVSFSFLLWKIFSKKKINRKSYWIKPKIKRDKFEDYLKQF